MLWQVIIVRILFVGLSAQSTLVTKPQINV